MSNAPARTTIAELPQICNLALRREVFQPIVLKGQPGIAKTQFFKNVLPELYAEHLGIQTEDIGIIQERVANRDAAEIAGVALPMKDDQGNLFTQFTKPPLISKIEQMVAAGHIYGIILLDELLQAGGDVQKVLADLLDPAERTLAGWPIPDGWIVVATGNRASDKAGSVRLLSHLGDRVRVLELEFEINKWAEWATDIGLNPIVIDCARAYYEQGFFAESVPSEDVQYCTPRSLEQAAWDLQAYLEDVDADPDHLPRWMEQVLASNIGIQSASTLCGYFAQADKVPSEFDLQNNPETCNVPEETGFQMIAGNKAVSLATDAESGEKALQYLVRLRPDLQVSLGTKLLRTSARRGWILTGGLAQQFIGKFHDLLPLAQSSGWK